MVEHPNSVNMAEKQREVVSNRDWDFPYVAMEADLTRYPDGCTPWHWHNHFEIAVVHSGCLELCTRQGSVILKQGEGYFLNADVLHLCRAAKPYGRACMHTQLFTGDVISGTGLISRRYISTMENSAELDVLLLKPDNVDHRDIINDFNRAFAAAEEDDDGYEMFVCANLASAWGKLYRMSRPSLRTLSPGRGEDAVRAKAMLSFIYENYMRAISVKDIAAAAGICERECFRCFMDAFGTTPMNYLARYRVTAAARMLTETDQTVNQIAEQCGFAGSSYFGKVFRRVMGCAPGEFRRRSE